MSLRHLVSKCSVAAFFATVLFSPPAVASSDVDALLEELKAAPPEQAQRIENRIISAWSKSGSASMDLLLKRGRDALDIGKFDIAVQHFLALTDHAPDFAEGWHGLALSFYQREQHGLAMDALERTLALNPKHFGALRGVGAVLEQTGRERLAYDAYQAVLDMYPQDADVLKAVERLEPKVTGQAL